MPRITSQHVERNLNARRNQSEQINGYLAYADQSKMLATQAQAEVDINSRRRKEHMKRVQAESHMQNMIIESERQAEKQARETQQNAEITNELMARKLDRERKEREIQRICNESEELKALERNLKIGYMNKERAAQHEEKLLMDHYDMEREHAIAAQMEADRVQALVDDHEKQKEMVRLAIGHKQTLQEQMEERKKLEAEAIAMAQKDKSMVDQVVAKIQAEDQKEFDMRRTRKETTRNVIKEYEIQRQQELAMKKREEEEEQRKIKAHMENVGARVEAMSRAKQLKEEADAKLFAHLAEESERQRKEADELQALRDMLWEEEMEQSRRQEDAAKVRRKEAQKADMALANKQMLAAKQMKMKLDAEEEARLVALMMDKFSHDEAAEQDAERQRQQKKVVYKEEISQQRVAKSQMYAIAKAQEAKEAEIEEEREAYKKAVVNEARQRLIAEHSRNLNGFMVKR